MHFKGKEALKQNVSKEDLEKGEISMFVKEK